MRTSEKNIQHFLTTTNCQFISGYRKRVDFIDACAFELLYFDLLQKYCYTSHLSNTINRNHPILSRNLSFDIV